MTLVSTSPLRDALRSLKQIAEANNTRSGDPIGLQGDDSVSVVDTLLGDIDRATRGEIPVCGDACGVDTTQLAALSTLIQAIDN
ncbi:hypothetical protein [Phormidium tenue]|uniref:hypothetical protein n=1 Tax=Phormidium tenue TaxID=126344 RepID=UPI0009FEE1BC|nr:hypothetical protein [Phormidium tenue]MBD2234800.1 hypothetical protein [Phormidium tenue FACHB-1052]